ncbi:hypothetical protein DGG96_00670 [Legionella qingyii]|uniref:Uncharacterized protein n=1 Tax=Legionella qingyii TaxID=2184757 RepID=A0A317U7T2_9GAMM|nr:hypothetical protein [Legionella qingyii]PWY57641.1 hypothetical protein DGG96_00670 [Legionella qingyii]RUR25891.1 hypothetical protein ELY20_01720 [Legionella qingyii]RUR29281.1 hypothetical protein ELY16_00345 [Legionella qingyii]
MWKKSNLVKGGSIFKTRQTTTNIERFFKLDSNMWKTSSSKQLVYLPISYGGNLLTAENALWKLRTLETGKCWARTMALSEFDRGFPLFLGVSTKIPCGLNGSSQLVKFLDDGRVDEQKTERAFLGHHKQSSEHFEGSALSFSHQWTIYHFFSLASGKTSIVLADSTAIPDDYVYIQGASETPPGYDGSGSPETYAFEHEVTVQDVPLIAMPGRLHRQGLKLVFSANPYFIDLQNKSLPEEVRALAQQAIQSFLIASAIQRTGKPVPGQPYITMEEAAQIQKRAIDIYIESLVEIMDMTSEQMDAYHLFLREMRGHGEIVHYTHIEVEEEEKEYGMEQDSTVKIEEITDEEAKKIEEKEGKVVEEEESRQKFQT